MVSLVLFVTCLVIGNLKGGREDGDDSTASCAGKTHA
jgi:hypothetical protein